MHSKPKIKDTIPGITKALVVLFLIAGVMSLNPKPASAVTENVVWTSLVNATASGNTITDTSSVAEGGGVSSQSITSGDGYVEFTVAGIDGNRAAGLNSNSSNQTLEEIDYAIRYWGGGSEIWENGNYRGETTYVTNDVFRIEIVSGQVRYKKNGTLFYTSAVAPTYPLKVDAFMATPNVTINNVIISYGSADTTPPTISSVASSSITQSGATITWSTNEASDTQVEYGTTTGYGNSTTLNTSMFTSHSQSITGLSASTLYHYRVKSRDAASNLATSGDFTFTTSAPASDTTPPTISITSPTAGATLSGTTSITTNASDNIGVVGVQFRLDGSNLGSEDTSSPFTLSWNTTTTTNSSHSLTAVARDAAGNTTTSSNISVTVNNVVTPPPPPPTPPPGSATWPNEPFGHAVIEETGWESGSLGNWYKIHQSSDKPIDVVNLTGSPIGETKTLELGFNQGHVGGGGTELRYDIASSQRSNELYVGYYFRVNSAWQGHNSGINKMLYLHDGGSGFAAMWYEVFGSGSGALDPYVVNQSGSSPSGFHENVTEINFVRGQWYRIEIYQKQGSSNNGIVKMWVDGVLAINRSDIDTQSNNVDNITLSGIWGGVGDSKTTDNDFMQFDRIRISKPGSGGSDTTPPTVSITAPTNGTTVSGTSTTISATATDNIGVVGVQFRLDGVNLGSEDTTSPYSVTWNTTTASNASHTLTAVARDAAGNTTTSSAITVTVNNPVTPPPPPSPPATLFQENFEDNNLGSRSWYDNTSALLSTTEHIAGSNNSAEYRFNQGATNPTIGGAQRHKFTATNSVYLSYYVKYSTNWVGSQQSYHPHEFHFLTNLDDDWSGLSFNKLTAYIEQNGGYPLMAIQDGENVDQSRIGQNLTTITENRGVAGCNGSSDGYPDNCYSNGSAYVNEKKWKSTTQYFSNNTGANYKNDWHFVEAYVQLNSISAGKGNNDGIIRYWFDGQQVINNTNVLLRTGANPTMQFNQFVIAPYIGDGSPVTQSFWIDNLTVATARPTSPTPPPPPAPPAISSFAASPTSITSGGSSTLSWSVSNATTLSINQGIGTVTGTSRSVSPTATTTYTLTATNSAGSVTAIATVTVSASNQPPVGNFDEIRLSDGVVRGWSYDPNATSTSNNVHIYIDGAAGAGGTLLSGFATNVLRSDVNSSFGITGNHGFEYTIPSQYRNGQQHSIYVYGIDTSNAAISTLLTGSPRTFTLSTPTPPPPPPPSGGTWPNQPSGFTRIAEYDGSSVVIDGPTGSQSSCSTGGILDGCWWKFSPGGNFSVTTDTSAPKSPGGVFQFRYPNGHQPGSSVGILQGWDTPSETSNTEYREIYESGWVKTVGSTFQNQAVGTKVLGYWGVGQGNNSNAVPNQFYGGVEGIGSTALLSSMTLRFTQQNQVDRGLPQTAGGAVFTAGNWHRYEIYLKLNDIGSSNGIFKLWWNGNIIFDYSDIQFRNSSNPSGFYGRRLDPVWGGIGGTAKTRDDFLQYDHVYISGITMTGTPTPPQPPPPPPPSSPGTVTNLSVTATTSNSATLSFTEVTDGTGVSAKYEVRFATPTITWGSASSVAAGTCSTPVTGTTIGATKTCTITGLNSNTAYQFQVVAFRGTLNVDAEFGNLSNIVNGTTSAATPPPPTVNFSAFPTSITSGSSSTLTWSSTNATGCTSSGGFGGSTSGSISVSPTTTTTYSLGCTGPGGTTNATATVTVIPGSTPVVGDINLDHIVNSIDYSILNSRWFTSDAAADLNDDGIVNAIDYSILNQNWFRTW